MKGKYFKLGTIAFLLSFNYAKTQTSPFTNSILQMSNIHENEGRANINIPIEKLEIKDYTLEISANYNSKGVKVNSESGDIGQNWDLSHKGLITRKVQDEPDEKKVKVTKSIYYGFYQNGTPYPKCYVLKEYNQVGLLYNLPLLKANVEKFYSSPNQVDGYIGYSPSKFNTNDYNKLLSIDKQSDLFTVAIPGKEAFDFYFDLEGNIKLNSNENYKISYEVDNYSFFKKFTLIDEQNVHFTFGSFETVKQDSETLGGGIDVQDFPRKKFSSTHSSLGLPFCDPNSSSAQYYYDKAPVSWYLSSVENKYGEKITYNYEQKKIVSLNVNTSQIPSSTTDGYYTYSAHINEIPIVTSITNGISSLKFNYGEIRKDMLSFDNPDFSNINRLISISSYYGNSKKDVIGFNNEYIISNDASGLTLQDSELAVYRRLFLKGIVFLNAREDKIKNEYNFEYNNPQALPHKQSYKTDFWGFYKNNPDTIPFTYVDGNMQPVTGYRPITRPRLYTYPDSGLNNVDRNYSSIYKRNSYTGSELVGVDVDKTPVLADLSIGLLSQMKSSGGSVYYQYDSNYFTYYGIKREGPGVRVKAIEINDGTSSTFTDYSYGENNDGIGYIDSLPVFTTYLKYWSGTGAIYSTPIFSQQHIADNTILYRKIRSTKRNESITDGYIINNYSLFDTLNNSTFSIDNLVYNSNRNDAYKLKCVNNCGNGSAQYQLDVTSTPLLLPEADMGRVNGKLVKQEIYNSNNILLESTEYNYQLKWNLLGKIFLEASRILLSNNVYDFAYGGVEKYYSFNYDPKNIVKTSFYSNGNIKNIKSYTYNNERKVIELKEQVGNDLTKTEFKYVYESNTPIGTAFRTQNRLNEIQESITTTNGGGVLKNRNIYNDFTFPNLSLTNQSIITSIKEEKSIDETNFFGSEEISRLGVNGNIIEKKYNGNVFETLIWGYKQTLPIARIYGASYQQVMQAFNLDPNNISSYLNLDIVKKSDLDIDDTSEDSFTAALETFKKKPELKEFQITTYAYDPLVGIKNTIKPSGQRENYKYDINNRLEKILDRDNEIIKEYQYNINTFSTKSFNAQKSKPFTRTNCIPGTLPSAVPTVYIVPAGKYFSLINQEDADQKAENDLNANGQNYANTNGICNPYVCTITPSYNISIYYSSFQETSTNHIKAILSFPTSNSNNSNVNWSGGVFIGTLQNLCTPNSYKSISSNGWNISIAPNGGITLYGGSSPGGVATLNFEYDK